MVVCSAIPAIPMSVGVSRTFQGKAVGYLLGDPGLPLAEEKALRARLTARALATLSADVSEPTLFSLE